MSNHPEIFKSKITSHSKSVYLYLERYGARNKQCFHSIKTIAKGLNISERTVNRSLNELESSGFIIRVHRYRKDGGKTSNLYEILK